SRSAATRRTLPRARAGIRCPRRLSAPRCARRSRADPRARSLGGGRPCLLRIPGGEHEAGGAIIAVVRDIVVLEDPEGFGRVVRLPSIFRVEDVSQFIA